MAATPLQDHLEVEWQFSAVDTRPVARWLESAKVPGYTVTPGKTKELHDTYYDTDDWRLHRAGFTCRVREKGDGAELTLKGMAEAADGMRQRRELNEPLHAHDLAHVASAGGPAGHAVHTVAGRHPLVCLFEVRTRRQLFDLADAEGRIGEIALDDTTIPVGEDVPVHLSRVEVEVDPVAIKRAQRFIDLLVATAGLTPAGPSKFESGLIAAGLRPDPRSPDLGPTTVTADMTAGEVGFAVMRKHFGVFLANESGTRLGEDIEALHDMRVAARRLRAAMAAFGAYLPPSTQGYRQELGWVAAALGEVRDLDVQLERMEEWRTGFTEAESKALDAIEALLTQRRERARKRMLVALNSRRYERLVARFSAALRRGARTYASGRVPVLAAAPDLLEKRYRRVRRLGDRIGAPSPPDDYHALRIEGKKLRYALEFVGGVYGRPAVDFSVRVTALQDVLGLHQDADVAIATLSEIAASHGRRLGPATVLAMGSIAERYRRHAVELRAQFPAVYRPIAGPEWRKLVKLIESRRPTTA